MYLMLSCSLRYAITRQSYITSMVAEWLMKYMPALTPAHSGMLIRELEMGIAQHHGQVQTIDEEVWTQALTFLKANIPTE